MKQTVLGITALVFLALAVFLALMQSVGDPAATTEAFEFVIEKESSPALVPKVVIGRWGTISEASTIMIDARPGELEAILDDVFADGSLPLVPGDGPCMDLTPVYTRETFPTETVPCECAPPDGRFVTPEKCYHVLIRIGEW